MIRVFEAFAGYGGGSFALKKYSIEHELVGFSEIDKYAVKCFEQNHRSKNYGDITKINWSEVPDFDLLTGGFPCQDISNAGHQDLTKGRSILGFELTKALVAKKPKWFLFENVKAINQKKFAEFKGELLKQWREAGYVVYEKCLNTKNFGVPQNRERVFFVGFRNDIAPSFGEFSFPSEVPLTKKLKDLLDDEVDEKYYLKDEQVKKLFEKLKKHQDKGNGFSEFMPMNTNGVSNSISARDYKEPKCIDVYNKNIREDGCCITLTEPHHNNLRILEPKCIELTSGESKANRIYSTNGCVPCLSAEGGGMGAKTGLYAVGCAIRQRDRHNKNEEKAQDLEIRTDEVSNSITTVLKDSMIILPSKVRRLTPIECFRLMGFKDGEINLDGLSDTQKYKLAGNGWDINVVSLIFAKMFNGAMK